MQDFTHSSSKTVPNPSEQAALTYFDLGAQAIFNLLHSIKRGFFALGRGIVWILLTPFRILYYLGVFTIAFIGAFGTRKGRSLFRLGAYRQAIAAKNHVGHAFDALMQTTQNIITTSNRSLRNLQTGIHNRRLRKKVMAVMQDHEKQAYEIQALQQRIAMLRTKKQTLESMLTELIEENDARRRASVEPLRRDRETQVTHRRIEGYRHPETDDRNPGYRN